MLADDTCPGSQRGSISHSIDSCRIMAVYVPFGDLKMFCTLIPAFKDLCPEFVNALSLHCSSLSKLPTHFDINNVQVGFIAL
jgi:hypothetical protein